MSRQDSIKSFAKLFVYVVRNSKLNENLLTFVRTWFTPRIRLLVRSFLWHPAIQHFTLQLLVHCTDWKQVVALWSQIELFKQSPQHTHTHTHWLSPLTCNLRVKFIQPCLVWATVDGQVNEPHSLTWLVAAGWDSGWTSPCRVVGKAWLHLPQPWVPQSARSA